jgi:hypothetical protein
MHMDFLSTRAVAYDFVLLHYKTEMIKMISLIGTLLANNDTVN